jgi:hypothetical protein
MTQRTPPLLLLATAVLDAPAAEASPVAYLVNVTVRPGYNQVSNLISQAAQELCPEQIWTLRNSAAHYTDQP